MKKLVLFIQGGGNGGYEADSKLAASLQKKLGTAYEVHYPKMLPDESTLDFAQQWLQRIGKEISSVKSEVVLVGHSLGASMLLKFLSENKIRKKIPGIFLIAPPFWSGDEDWVKPLKLKEDFSDKLPKEIPIYFYHCKDDETSPFEHLKIYKNNVPWAIFREVTRGGHQFNNDLSIVAKDIKSL
ncbi:alpha/beta hydrolase [Melioribacter sp. OK-6-Me]|uniref:alpha/beta hydrolase n=1 Tax=Melioribacter sp. OK-6-Me TaxID=3423433 RepID=UPI003ED8C4C8